MLDEEIQGSVSDQVAQVLKQVDNSEYFVSLHYAQMNVFIAKESQLLTEGSLFCTIPGNPLYIPLTGYIPFSVLEKQIARIRDGKTTIAQVDETASSEQDYLVTCSRRLAPHQLSEFKKIHDKHLLTYCLERYQHQKERLQVLADRDTQKEFFDQLSLAFSFLKSELDELLVQEGDDILFEGTFLGDEQITRFYPSSMQLDPDLYAKASPQDILSLDARVRESLNSKHQLSCQLNEIATHVLSLYLIDEQLTHIIPLFDDDLEESTDASVLDLLQPAIDLYLELHIHTHTLRRTAEQVRKGTIDLLEYFGIPTHWIDFSDVTKEIVLKTSTTEIPRRFVIEVEEE